MSCSALLAGRLDLGGLAPGPVRRPGLLLLPLLPGGQAPQRGHLLFQAVLPPDALVELGHDRYVPGGFEAMEGRQEDGALLPVQAAGHQGLQRRIGEADRLPLDIIARAEVAHDIGRQARHLAGRTDGGRDAARGGEDGRLVQPGPLGQLLQHPVQRGGPGLELRQPEVQLGGYLDGLHVRAAEVERVDDQDPRPASRGALALYGPGDVAGLLHHGLEGGQRGRVARTLVGRSSGPPPPTPGLHTWPSWPGPPPSPLRRWPASARLPGSAARRSSRHPWLLPASRRHSHNSRATIRPTPASPPATAR